MNFSLTPDIVRRRLREEDFGRRRRRHELHGRNQGGGEAERGQDVEAAQRPDRSAHDRVQGEGKYMRKIALYYVVYSIKILENTEQ